jgi:CRP/FNR family transcriptional regulator, cyclic AMP receptor protein
MPRGVRVAKRGHDVLSDVPLFSELSKRHLRRVAELMEEEQFPEGAAVVEEGDQGDSLYVIIEGQADVVRGKRTVDHLLPGDFFGEVSLLDGGPRTATVTAATPLTLFAIRRKPFSRMLQQEPEIAVKILTALTRRFRTMQRSLAG